MRTKPMAKTSLKLQRTRNAHLCIALKLYFTMEKVPWKIALGSKICTQTRDPSLE